MKASAGAAKTSAAKFCNCATGIQRGSGNSANETREDLAIQATPGSPRVAQESTLHHRQMPPCGRVLGARQNICKYQPPLSQIYEVQIIPSAVLPSPARSNMSERRKISLWGSLGFTIRRVHDVVCFAEYTNRVLRKDVDQENQEQVNRFISFDLCFQLMKSSVNS